MSAYMVEREHIQYLLSAAMSRQINKSGGMFTWFHAGHRYELNYSTADAVGQMLWDENRRSIEARYPDTAEDFTNAPGPIGEDFVYSHTHAPVWSTYDPVQVLKSVDCLEYQSCEHDGWKDSQAKVFLLMLSNSATYALPGYDDAKWGAPKTDHERRAAHRLHAV
jgi:hypothetical protein